MKVKELIELLKNVDQDAEIVLHDYSMDSDDTHANAYVAVDVEEGFFDGEVGQFININDIDSDEEEVFGEDAVAISFEAL